MSNAASASRFGPNFAQALDVLTFLFIVASDLATLQRDDGQWAMSAKSYAGTRDSGLDQIDTHNVGTLQEAWTFATGIPKGHEAAPLVIGDTMYVVTPFPNDLIAFDLSKPGAPQKWRFEPHPERAAQGVACCDVVNRGAAYTDGIIIYNTLDVHTVAVDTKTGKELWRTKLGDYKKGETMTMAPLVVRDKVFVGNSGGELGVRGWLAALDTHSGRILWRAYATGPDSDVLIGPKFKPYYASERGTNLGVTSWPPDRWQTGGGTAWGFVTYDPELDLIFYGTGNPGPWNPEARPGDNKWTCGIFARKPDTGEAVWFYQTSPHDLFDHDGINESIVTDLTIDGRKRKVIIHPGRTGYVYVLDRATGEVISATPYTTITTSRGVDVKTGELQRIPEKAPGSAATVRDICPASPGGKDWSPASYSATTGLLYIPSLNLCQDEQDYEANYIEGTPYLGSNVRMYTGHGGYRGALVGWNVAEKKAVFTIKENFPIWSGTLVTAGGIVFYGTMDGWFKAIDARTGALLWKHAVSSGVIGQPITYRGPDGKQYVTVLTGVGGWAGAILSGNLDPRDHTGALGFSGAMGDLRQYTQTGSTIYTFGLP